MADPFGVLLDSFTLALEAEGKSPKTVDNYSRAVLAFVGYLHEHGLADDVTTVTADDVRRFLVGLRGKVAPSTEYRNYSGLRQFFAWCVREDELDVSPMANVRPPKVPEPRTQMLTAAQIKALLAGCAGRDFVSRRDVAIILLRRSPSAVVVPEGACRGSAAPGRRASGPQTTSSSRVG
jgi:integrase/recombinase XerD